MLYIQIYVCSEKYKKQNNKFCVFYSQNYYKELLKVINIYLKRAIKS